MSAVSISFSGRAPEEHRLVGSMAVGTALRRRAHRVSPVSCEGAAEGEAADLVRSAV